MRKTKIPWAQSTWNPIRGCTKISPGCEKCYAERMAARFAKPGQPYETVIADGRWSGNVILSETSLKNPTKWAKPRLIFVNSMADLFHEGVKTEWIDRIFAVMSLASWHVFQVLTKRPDRMRKYLSSHDVGLRWAEAAHDMFGDPVVVAKALEWTKNGLPNVWIGATVEDQERANARIPELVQTPAALRFVSVEPMIGKVSLSFSCFNGADSFGTMPGIGWVICGGENDLHPRLMDYRWAQELKDECVNAGVPFFFKQFSGFKPDKMPELDGRIWQQMPEVRQ